ncbi:MAG: hypothetical protein HY891_04300 [Deltaproteobacteria bacterium]|nr:hypothetical protein [Deltaproteobacteria bacterium]
MMKSRWAKPVLDSIIHFSAWFFAWLVILFLSTDNPSRYVYATISAWWCSLYVGYIRGIGLRPLLPLFVINMSGITVSLAFGLGWFLGRHDALTFSEATLNDFILATMVSYVILSSPVIINSTVRYVIGRRRPE